MKNALILNSHVQLTSSGKVSSCLIIKHWKTFILESISTLLKNNFAALLPYHSVCLCSSALPPTNSSPANSWVIILFTITCCFYFSTTLIVFSNPEEVQLFYFLFFLRWNSTSSLCCEWGRRLINPGLLSQETL